MMYALLPNKQRQSYNRAFSLLKDVAMTHGIDLDPAIVICDFELAIIQALALNFPNSRHQGCYYHFMQALWRKVQALGLASHYSNPQDTALKNFVQKMGAIAFCPPAFVRPAWISVQQEAPQLPRVDELVEYLSATWVRGNYQIRQWNYYKVEGPRTNNHVEGWHSRLKKIVGKAHPNIYELVEVIQKEEALTTMRVQQLVAGASQPPRSRKVKDKDRKIQTLFQRLELGTITLGDYLDAIIYHTGL